MATILKHITFFVLKLMRLKHNFSKDPVDYQKIRKTDRKKTPKYFYRKFHIIETALSETSIISIESRKNSNGRERLILYIPGGAFISGPAPPHWDTVGEIAERAGCPVWLVDYPKAPEYNIHQINQNIDAIYSHALQKVNTDKLSLVGDSVGATLIMSLTQRLIAKQEKTAAQLVLITPVFDASMTNEAIDEIDKVDPMLSKKGILSAKKMCAQTVDLKDPIISPLYGSFNGFPKTMLVLAGKDIMYPDGVLAAEKMKEADVVLTLIDAPEMPHIYPLLPIMLEAKKILVSIVDRLSTV